MPPERRPENAGEPQDDRPIAELGAESDERRAAVAENLRAEAAALLAPLGDVLHELPLEYPERPILQDTLIALRNLLNPDAVQGRASRLRMASQALSDAAAAAEGRYEEIRAADSP
jgi:hypothetical protein